MLRLWKTEGPGVWESGDLGEGPEDLDSEYEDPGDRALHGGSGLLETKMGCPSVDDLMMKLEVSPLMSMAIGDQKQRNHHKPHCKKLDQIRCFYCSM